LGGSRQLFCLLCSRRHEIRKYVDYGILQMHSEYGGSAGPEEYFQRAKTLVERHRATCLVIDPFTAFSNAESAARPAEGEILFV
jgi:hypothetical protein